ncbi:MAG: NUDIX domain-containing protein [Candidatus Micrarchaeia archaeon]
MASGETIHERSAGIIVYNIDDCVVSYLLLHYGAGHWDFPKGHIEENEDEKSAAIRETSEETGISNLEFVDFREKLSYWYWKGKERSFKEVVFFLARTGTKEVRLSHEHIGYIWLPYESALKKLTYDTAKEMLKKAYNRLVELRVEKGPLSKFF